MCDTRTMQGCIDSLNEQYRMIQVFETYVKRMKKKACNYKMEINDLLRMNGYGRKEKDEIEQLQRNIARLCNEPLNMIRQPVPAERIFLDHELNPELIPFDLTQEEIMEELEYANEWRTAMKDTIRTYGSTSDKDALDDEPLDRSIHGEPCMAYNMERNCQMKVKCNKEHV